VYKVVFPAAFSISPTLIYMTSEMAACHFVAFTKAELEGTALEKDSECGGIIFGTSPLLLILCALFMGKVSFVHVRSAFTMKSMSTLDLTFVESIQLVLFSICAFFAMTAYALRSERVVVVETDVTLDFREDKVFAYFTVLLMIATFLNFFKQGVERDEEALEWESDGACNSNGSERMSGGRSGSGAPKRLSSLDERISVGNRKSIWDGGTKGARSGSDALKSASKRGIAAERKSAEEAIGGAQFDVGEGDDFSAISPGFV
jgi:hypothetical protein